MKVLNYKKSLVKISVNMIELLESENVPMAKKRMVMKNSFGDYRKLMK